MISLVVWLRAKEGCEAALRQALAANAAASRLEPGCLRWEFARHLEDPREFVICELYADAAALAAHHASEHVARWRETTPELIEAKKSGRYEVLGGGPEAA